MAQLFPRIQQITADLLDSLSGEHAVDLVHRLAFPLTLTVIGDLLGIPARDGEALREWATAVMEDSPERTVPRPVRCAPTWRRSSTTNV